MNVNNSGRELEESCYGHDGGVDGRVLTSKTSRIGVTVRLEISTT